MAAAVSSDPDLALRVHTREELGVDALSLPSAVVARGASLVAFSLGAPLPLLPYLLGLTTLLAALVVTAIALLSGGMLVGLLTGRPLLRSGIRQFALGSIAVLVTYCVGVLIGSPINLRRRSRLAVLRAYLRSSRRPWQTAARSR